MRFMSMVKSNERMSGPPPKALMEAIDHLAQNAAKDGCVMVQAGGLLPTSSGMRVRLGVHTHMIEGRVHAHKKGIMLPILDQCRKMQGFPSPIMVPPKRNPEEAPSPRRASSFSRRAGIRRGG
jgi:hypothetical protein